MSDESRNTVPTGVAPIDEAIGGLERGRVHLLYGELDTGKTTIAMRFLAEGLAIGDRCLLVTRYPAATALAGLAGAGRPTDADLASGRLALFEYATELVDLLGRFDDLRPILDELEVIAAEFNPDRIVFDTADFVFSIQQGYGHTLQISAFLHWLSGTGATTLLVVEERVNERIVQSFRANAPAVLHSMVRRFPDRVEHHLAFEKGPVKAPHRRIGLEADGRFVTYEIYDAKARTLPLPAAPGRKRSGGDRTGQLTMPEEAAQMVAEAAAGPSGPLGEASAAGGSVYGAPTRRGRPRVLLIDADRVTALLVARAVEPECDLEVEKDGISGLAKIGTFDPDLVIVELDLPLVDGFAICRQIREASRVPVVAVSGSRVSEADRMRSAEAGADLFLSKPFGLRELGLRSRQLIARYRGEATPFAATLPDPVPDPLVPFDRVVALLTTGAAGKALIGCRIAVRAAGQRALVVDAVRTELHPEDVLAFDKTTGRLVVLVAPEAAETVATQLSRRVLDVVGLDLQFLLAPVAPQVRPIDDSARVGVDGERL
jgi:DNA-binding response OmpR family regulator/archaellum biogenesis ATPase FlaH